MSTTFSQIDDVFNRVTSPDITADILNVSMLGTLLPDIPIHMEPPFDCVHRVIEKLNEIPDFITDPDLEAELKHRMQGGALPDKPTSYQRTTSTGTAKKRQPKRPITKPGTDTKSTDNTLSNASASTSPGKAKAKRSRVVTTKPCIKYLSTAGCADSDCKFSHRLPLGKDEATKVSSLQSIRDLEASADMIQAISLVTDKQLKSFKTRKGSDGGKKQT